VIFHSPIKVRDIGKRVVRRPTRQPAQVPEKGSFIGVLSHHIGENRQVRSDHG